MQYLPAIQLHARRTVSRRASASFSLRRLHHVRRNQQLEKKNGDESPDEGRRASWARTSIESGGGGAVSGEGGGDLAVLALVALEHLAHGCSPRSPPSARPNPPSESIGGLESSGKEIDEDFGPGDLARIGGFGIGESNEIDGFSHAGCFAGRSGTLVLCV
jgi:hypothetical protein